MQHIEAARETAAEKISLYQGLLAQLERERAGHPAVAFWGMTLRYGIHHGKATVSWCEETLAILSDLNSTQPNPR